MNNARTNDNAFRVGFVAAMRKVREFGPACNREARRWAYGIADNHTAEYMAGAWTGIDHWLGISGTHGIDRAHELGLIAEYQGYWGQSDWHHPSP